MFYGTNVWDPVLIIAQIVTVQCLYYISLGGTLYVFVGSSSERHLSIAYLFDYAKLTTSTALGWKVIVSFLASSLLGALVLYFVIERTKKCLDFAVTCYGFHLVACALYAGFPLSLEWWITVGLSSACMTLVGESLCMKKEMRDIDLPSARPPRGNSKRQKLINFLKM